MIREFDTGLVWTYEPSRGKASLKFLANSAWPSHGRHFSLPHLCRNGVSRFCAEKTKNHLLSHLPQKTWDFIMQTGVERVTLTMWLARFATNCWFSNMSSRNSKGDTDTQIPPFDISDICPAWDRSGLSSRNGPLWLLTLVCSCPIWHHFFSFISLALIALHN